MNNKSQSLDSANESLRESTNQVRRERWDDRWVYVKRYQNDNWDASPLVITQRLTLEIATLDRIAAQKEWHRRLGKICVVETDVEHGLLVTEEVPGWTLTDWIHYHYERKDYRKSLRVHYLAGRWVKLFQRLKVTEAERRPIGSKNPEGLTEYLVIRIDELKRLGYRGLSDRQWKSLIRKFCRLESEIEQSDRRLVMCHNDYSPGNIITDGYHVTPIDYQMTAPGSPLLDVAYFLHRAEMARLYRPWLRRPWKQWRNAFIAGYGRADLTETPLYKSLLIRLYVLRLLTYARPKNPSIKETLHCKWLMAAIRHKLLRELKS